MSAPGRRRRGDRALLVLGAALLLSGGAIGCVPLPPPRALGPEVGTTSLDADEQALWKESRRLQHEIQRSGLLFDDPALAAYLERVLERVTPPELGAAGLDPRVDVISNVNIDGYSFANGVIYIHTGLLARMQDETDLAMMLSRELAHVVLRHALHAKRLNKLSADSLAWIGVASTVVEGGGQVKLLAQAASITSAVGFGHAQETAADEKGLAYLDAAGYAVGGVPAFYQRTLDYLAEVHAQGVWGWAPFTPPLPVTARIDGLTKLIQARYTDQRASRPPLRDAAGFRRGIHPAVLRQAELERAAGLFLSAEQTARAAVESDPRDVDAWILLGQALSGQRSKRLPNRSVPSIRQVREAYGQALRVDPDHAEATRELGMTFYRTTGTSRSAEDSRSALRHLRRYLELAPRAGDRAYVAGYIEELEGDLR